MIFLLKIISEHFLSTLCALCANHFRFHDLPTGSISSKWIGLIGPKNGNFGPKVVPGWLDSVRDYIEQKRGHHLIRSLYITNASWNSQLSIYTHLPAKILPY